jgi:hypothetical protein
MPRGDDVRGGCDHSPMSLEPLERRLARLSPEARDLLLALPEPQRALLAAVLGADGRPRGLAEAAELLGVHLKLASRIEAVALRQLGPEAAAVLMGTGRDPETGTG